MKQSRQSLNLSNLTNFLEPNPVVVTPEILIVDVVRLMNQTQDISWQLPEKDVQRTTNNKKNSSYVLVISEEQLVGTFTAKDLVRLVASQIDLSTTTIAEVMTQPVLTMARSQCQNIWSVWSFLQEHSLSYVPIVNDSQKLLGVISLDSILQAITPQDLEDSVVEPTMTIREEELRDCLENAATGLHWVGADGVILWANQAELSLLGYEREEYIGHHIAEFHADTHVIDDILQRLSNKETLHNYEARLRCKDGSIRHVLISSNVLVKDGEFVHTRCFTQDISDRKQAELALKKERDFTTAIFNTVGALVTVLDRQGRIINFNRTCEQVTGYRFEEIVGRQIWEILILSEEKKVVRAIFERLLRGQLSNQYENHWLAKDGSSHLISWSNTALLDSQGKIEFIVATGIDVTEQRKVQDKLEHQYRQTQLLADITHKIRRSIELEEILQTTVTEVQHLLACDRVMIVELKANNTAVPVSEAIIPEFPPMLGYEIADPLLKGKYLTKYHQGKILSITDVQNAAIDINIKQLLQQFAIQAKLVVPILSLNQLKGLLIAHQCSSPRQWQDKEIELLQQLANQLGVALSQAQLLDSLEEMVEERTNELTTINQRLQQEIKERQQTEMALRENQQMLAGILDNADEAIISINEEQKIQLFNYGAEKIFGYSTDEVIGEGIDILIPKVFREIHRQHINNFGNSLELARTMSERHNSVYGLRKNGEEFPAEASISKLHLQDKLLFTVMLKDISQRQQALEKLQASQNLLVKAEKIAHIGSWEYNLITKQLSWSEELFQIWGLTSTQFIPSCPEIFACIHPEDRNLVRNIMQQGHQHGQPWQFNYRLLQPDGSLKYLESRGEPTTNEQGQVLKVWGTIMDITERVQAEISLRRSQEQLQLITDALPILISYVDNQQRYLYNNRTYETWFGKPRTSLLGVHVGEVLGEDYYQKALPYIEVALAGNSVTFEIEPRDDRNNPYWVSATYIPDFDTDGNVKGFFAMVDDITERKAIEQMKSEFVSVASHEMRTPLTSIHGVLKLMAAGHLGNFSEQGQELIEIAIRNTDRLVRLLNDVLDLERMESGRETIERQYCSSAELIQQAIATMQSMAQQHQITIEADLNSIKLWVDRDRILQTLTNLLSNAIKFSSAKSKVWVASQQQGNQVLFTVKDQGRGIPADKLNTIFERFQQVDASDSRKKGGTGLGLAICNHIIEQHGGKIWAESALGEGSTFFFTLPQQSS